MKIGLFASAEYTAPPPSTVIFPQLHLIADLANGLVKRGHDVTLFAPKGSKTSAQLVHFDMEPPDELRTKKQIAWELKGLIAYEQVMLSKIYLHLKTHHFDVFHSHDPLRTLPFVSTVDTPTIFTMHTPVKPSYQLAYTAARKVNYTYYPISISKNQQHGSESIGWFDVVYNGIDLERFPFSEKGGPDLMWAGRIHPDKGTDTAIELAQKLNHSINLVGHHVPEDEVSTSFWHNTIEPMLKQRGVHHVGMVDHGTMTTLYQNAKAFLFPIRWQEPFGLVVIEALACGTPPITFDQGSMSELVKDGETGFVLKPDDTEGMAKVIEKIYAMPDYEYRQLRQRCRESVEKMFSLETMVENYERVYQRVIDLHQQ